MEALLFTFMKRKSINLSLSIVVVVTATLLTIIDGCKKQGKVDLPVLTTNTPTDITPISTTCGGTVTSEGGESTWIRGLCWSTAHNPTTDPSLNFDGVADSNETYNGVSGIGTFSFSMGGLKPLTKYYVRAFAENSAGVGYGNEVSFSTPALVIGAKLPDGIVFDIDNTGLHGLACAPADEGQLGWSTEENVTIGSTDFENGYENTYLITSAEYNATGNYAALACIYHGGGQYGDPGMPHGFIWYLPSKIELNKLYSQKNVIGGFSDGEYWSSTEFDINSAWMKDFSNGKETATDKATTHHVRAIRAF